VLIPGVTAWSIQKVPGTLLVYNMGRAKLIMVLAMIGAVMNIGLNLAALEWTNLGIVGVAGASSISYIVVAALVLIYARSAMKLADTPETAL
jgi:Na+-driven multidrug efflux pump